MRAARDWASKRITLKPGPTAPRAGHGLKWSSGPRSTPDHRRLRRGTGMSPWRMMEEWGMPSIYLHSRRRNSRQLAARASGCRTWPSARFSAEDHIFKALSLGAPFCKAVCMGRAMMIRAWSARTSAPG